jgi:hypothetical protein
MAFVLKCIIGLFVLTGIAIAFYGLWEVLGTMAYVKNSPERAKATFIGYDREVVETTSTSPSPNWEFQQDFHKSQSIMSYPCFEYQAKDGSKHQVRESKAHLIERFKPGQELEIILPSFQPPRLAGFYSLYVRDLSILFLGLCFIFIPLLIGKVAIPLLETSAGIKLTRHMKEAYESIVSTQIGPVTVGFILKGAIGLSILMICLGLSLAVTPYIKQLRLGTGWGLSEALEKKKFDVARELIIKRKGINKVNEYNQNPLLLALEANQSELAGLLIEAGADVNIKSKMYMTPLRVATQSGNLEMVKLLLAKGASPDAPEDEFPPLFYALSKGNDEIARVLIEGGTDLNRTYIAGERSLTAGDMTLLAKKPMLVELIRQRGGAFTRNLTSRP